MSDSLAPLSNSARRSRWTDYLAATGVVGVSTLISGVSQWWNLTEANVVMIFLAGVVLAAARLGRGPTLWSAALSIVSYNFFHFPPMFGFAPFDVQYAITLVVMMTIALLINETTSRLRVQLTASRRQERRTAQLYQMTRRLGEVAGVSELSASAGDLLSDGLDSEVAIFVYGPDRRMHVEYGRQSSIDRDPASERFAEAAAARKEILTKAASGSDDRPIVFAPMTGIRQVVGVVAVRPLRIERFDDVEETELLATCASLVALSLEREISMSEAQHAQTQVETEKLRNTLLTSISHDLRSPLATIAVTTSSLLEGSDDELIAARRDVVETIVDETRQLSLQVDNLLDLGRLESDQTPLARDWQILEELIEIALARLGRELAGREVVIDVPREFPMLHVADDLMVQVFVNVLANSARYTPPNSRIHIRGIRRGEQAEISVADNGPGFPPGLEDAVFDKFVRGVTKIADGRRGLGLGLAICRSIVRAHGGEITARNLPTGGAELLITLTSPRESPQVTLDEVPQTLDGS